MARLIFDKNNHVDVITLILETKAGKKHGSLYGVTDIVYKKNFNQPDELSFGVSKYIDGHINRLWDYIVDLKVIYIPEFQEKFEIKVSYNDDERELKSVTATSLCEAELSQIPLRNLEINSPDDIDREDYKLTTFYNEDDPTHSLLHRVLSQKAPHYSIKFVDNTLKNLAFEFSANEKSIYDFLVNDVAQKIQCVFIFDSVSRTISAFDLCSTCNDCYEAEIGKDKDEWKHYRGEFHDICPHCGSENILEGYGRNTSIMINRENFATSITKECDVDSLKNCFYVECDDELINAAFILANPNGSQYIYYFSDEILADMPHELVSAINEYNEIYNDYISSHVFDTTVTTHIYNADTETMSQNEYIPKSPDSNYVASFNNVVNQVLSLSAESPYIDCKAYISKSVFTGQRNLVSGYYNAIDFESFLQTSMMPTYEMEVYNKYHALSLLNSANFGSVAIAGFGSATVKTLADNAVLSMAKALINTALFSVDIYTSSYSTGGTVWTGKFIITDLVNDNESTNTITNDNYLAVASKEGVAVNEIIPVSVFIQINGDYVTYSKNKIAKILAKEDLPTSIDLYSPETTLNEFNKQIKLHSVDNLILFYDVLDSCAGVLQEEMSNIKDKSNSVYAQMNAYYQLYRNKMSSINTFIAIRNSQIVEVKKYKALLSSYITETQSKLDFKSFLNSYSDTLDLWTIFSYYRREDTYKNSNITSDNLKTNSEILQYAGHLMNFAKKELITAGTMQYSLSSSLNNLLLHKEFIPLVDVFEVGNWIRLRTDIRDDKTEDLIYKLRLLSYEIRFDNVQTINVTFSTVTRTINGINDIKSVLDSAKSMATSYTGIERQVEKSTDISSIVSNWVTDGLDMTRQKIMNDIHSQELVIDSHGLLARKLLDMAGLYDDCQLRIINNGLYTTQNGWLTIDTGIGKIYYTDPETGEDVEDYGIIAKTVIGKLFLGENLGIYTPNGLLKFDENGLLITNGTNTFQVNPNDKKNLLKIISKDSDVFSTNSDGELKITGDFNAKSISAKDKYSIYSNSNEIDIITSSYVPNPLLKYGWDIKFQLSNLGYIQLIETNNIDFVTGEKLVEINLVASKIFAKGTLYTSDGTISVSDEKLKNSIEDLDMETSSKFIYSLQPKKYKLNHGTSNRYHHGLLSGQVKESMLNDDWGVFVDTSICSNEKESYQAIRYEELIADLIATIKSQNERISKIESKLESLENKLKIDKE